VCKDSSHTLFTVNEVTFNSNSDIETQVKMSLKFITYCCTWDLDRHVWHQHLYFVHIGQRE